MIEILESPSHLVAMRISGEMTGTDFDKAAAAVDAALAADPRISVYAELADSFTYTLEGLYKDIKYDLGLIGRLGHFYRAAVVTDKRWIAGFARAEGIVFSSVDIRVFPMSSRDEGIKWASEIPPAAALHGVRPLAIHFIETNSPNVLAYEIDGRVSEKDMENAIRIATEAFSREGHTKVLGNMRGFAGFDLKGLTSSGFFGMKSKALSKVSQYAVVGPPPWMRNMLELIDPMLANEIRTFDADSEDEAWEWIGARPIGG